MLITVIDNYDSFTFNLVHYIMQSGADVEVFRNNKITIDEIIALNPDAIVISPGPGRPEDAGISVDVIKNFSGKLPILGVCLGHQAIG
ncbi:MAG: aminodeoxychorismate/anthranilate synthase component II, partial [Desulfamplus sp.]